MELDVTFDPWDICFYAEKRNFAIKFFESHGYDVSFLENWPEEKEEKNAREKLVHQFFQQSFVFSISDLMSSGLPFSCNNALSPKKETHYLIRLNAKIEKAIEEAKKTSYSQTVNIYSNADDQWLHKVNKVIVEEDLCTDELQKYLEQEYRIISVCMQKGARRPDYVLGKVMNN